MATREAMQEEIQKYLVSKDISSLLKWMTTEMVLVKPDDPVVFLHDLTKSILSQPGYKYATENIEEMITNAKSKCEEKVTNEVEADESKQSFSSRDTQQTPIQCSNEDISTDLSTIIDSMRQITVELNPKKAAQLITKQTCKLLQCEKAILYTYDTETQTIQINSENSVNNEMKFSANQGIIGRCITNDKFEIIDNVNQDKDYENTVDKMLNIQTRNLICYPLRDFETGDVYAAIEAINKKDSNSFSKHDVDLLNALGTIGQITLQNGIIYEMAASEKLKNTSMLALWSHLNDESKVFNINSLLFTITRRCLEIVDAAKCTFYFVDYNSNELWSMQGEVNIRMPMSSGLAGLCATGGKIINEENVYKSKYFDKAHDEKTGFVTKSMLCVPMKGSENKVIGVIQLINKKGIIEVFDQNDEQILELVLSAASTIVEQNRFSFDSKMQNNSPKADEKFVSDLNQKTVNKRKNSIPHDIGALIEETESNESNDSEKKEIIEKQEEIEKKEEIETS
eukprot:359330_1